jgi:mono/diheme cytochrome c family protein
MARRRLVAGIAFAGLGWSLFMAHSQGFSQNTPATPTQTPAAVTENPPDARAETQAAIAKYCVTCHNERLRTAGLVLDPASVARPGDQSETWEKVLRQLRAGTMPPPGVARPPQAFYARAAGYLARELETSAAARPNAGSVPLAHRLTRTEYANVIRDLLALPDLPKEFDYATLLPPDNASSGFDNLADTLFVSPATMERYLEAALKISRVAVGDPDMGALVNTHITPVRQPQESRNEALPFGTRGGLQLDGYFPLDAEYEFKVETAGIGAEVHQLEISIDGERKAITNVSRRPGVPAAGDDAPNRGAFRFAVPAGPRSVAVAFVERSEALSEAPLRPPGRNRGALPSVVSVTITGPFNATGPGDTPSRRRLFVCRPSTRDARAGEAPSTRDARSGQVPSTRDARSGQSHDGDESVCADRILTTLLRRAYRRNVTADDLQRVRRFYEAGRAERDFDRGIQRALERVLVSPQFLFRIEQEPAGAAPGSIYRVGDFELASRLSFFLWSSMPDDELLDAAAAGTLRQPEVLRHQVTRMLADPRSRSLVTNFAAQWLFLRDVETKEPDVYLFRDFDEGVRAAFVRETELFLDSILRPSTDAQGAPSTVEGRDNRSVLELLTADYTFLNERLAKHYGIPQITGSHFRRVTLPKGSPRRGLLGQGSILSITSYSTRTSAVLRGKYVLENLLASPPPPPPPNVPSLNTESSGKPLSMKEAMQLHRANPACAGCHAKMDPIGFALESFDALGRWRAEENGRPLEVASALPDGTVVDGVEGVRQLVLRDPALFVEAITGKLLMYALARNIQHYDQPTIRVIARESARQNYTFASLVLGVVSSVPFQSRMAQRLPERLGGVP